MILKTCISLPVEERWDRAQGCKELLNNYKQHVETAEVGVLDSLDEPGDTNV